MLFHTRVGVLPHEQELDQPLEIDLTVWLLPVQSDSGQSEVTLDYRTLYDMVATLVHGRAIAYLEELGSEVARQALALPRVNRVRVAVRKPHVALPGPLIHAEVVVDLDQK